MGGMRSHQVWRSMVGCESRRTQALPFIANGCDNERWVQGREGEGAPYKNGGGRPPKEWVYLLRNSYPWDFLRAFMQFKLYNHLKNPNKFWYCIYPRWLILQNLNPLWNFENPHLGLTNHIHYPIERFQTLQYHWCNPKITQFFNLQAPLMYFES